MSSSSISLDSADRLSSFGVLFLRVVAGTMIFVIHGVHKLVGGLACLRTGAPWPLLEDVVSMHAPAPLASAFFATAVQLVCSPLLAFGIATRLNAAALTLVLGGAVTQNVLAGRDPQLAVLYTLVTFSFVFIGGGRWSYDGHHQAAFAAANARSSRATVL